MTGDFAPTGFFALRAALLPFDVLLQWAEGLSCRVSDLHGPALEDALAADRHVLCARLRRLIAEPLVQEALYLASPATRPLVERWLDDPDVRNPKLERALTRYLERMAGRATPFGLFAGCAVGEVGSETVLRFERRAQLRRSTRLDTQYVFALTAHLSRDESVRQVKRFEPNSSLYKSGERWRYVRAIDSTRSREHQLVALDSDEYLDGCIQRARGGATVAELADALVASDTTGEITIQDATAYVSELIDRQVLISDLSPLVTGSEPLDGLIASLEGIDACARHVQVLSGVRARLREMDRCPSGVDVDAYRHVERQLQELSVVPDPAQLFQVDLSIPIASATIGPAHVAALADAAQALRLMTSDDFDPLREFRDAFVERYGQQEVPLVEALDEESGIGFGRLTSPTAEPAPLLHGLPLQTTQTLSSKWTRRDAFLLGRLQALWRTGDRVLHLSADDLQQMTAPESRPLPDAFAVFATLLETPADSHEPNVVVRNMQGPSGGALLGRFCHLDASLRAAVRDHLTREESFDPEAIFAEIVHLPQGRLGNILARPLLREYEIPYLGRSGAPAARQIPITDLHVAIENDTVILRSARLGRRVIPRLTNAHNYQQGHSTYRFLCTLQMQGVAAGIAWTWGALAGATFLPRVVVGRAVLAKATWRLTAAGVKSLCTGTFAEQWNRVQSWRAAEGLPRFAALIDSDHELAVDFENPLSIETMLAVLKAGGGVLVEVFPTPDRLPVESPSGRHVHEVILPFVRQGKSLRVHSTDR